MVTYAQAQERAEEWINGDVPAYQHREVRVREFELGFVVWGEDRAEGPRSDAGAQRLVIARDSGDATLWPALPVGEVIRRYEEKYGRVDEPEDAVPTAAPARVDLNQTSFLLSPPEWLQEAADKLGLGERPVSDERVAGVPGEASATGGGPVPAVGGGAGGVPTGAGSGSGFGSGGGASARGGAGLAETRAGVPAAAPEAFGGTRGGPGVGGAPAPVDVPPGATPWSGTDTNADSGEDDRCVPLPATVLAPQVGDSDDGVPRPTAVVPDAKTELLPGGSQLPPTAVAQALDASNGLGVPPGSTPPPGTVAYGFPPAPAAPGAPAPGAPAHPSVPAVPPVPPVFSGAPQDSVPPPPRPGAPSYGYPQAPGGAPDVPQPQAGPGAPARRLAPNAGDIADAATSKAAPPPRKARGGVGAPPPPPGAPGVPGSPGARDGGVPPSVPGTPPGGYVPTQLVSALGPEGAEAQAGAGAQGGSAGPQGAKGVAAPGAPNTSGAPEAPVTPPGAPGGTPPGNVHQAATVLADPGRLGGGAPQPPGAPGGSGAAGTAGVLGAAGGAQGAVHHAETVLAAPPIVGPGVPPPPAPGAPGGPGVPKPAPPGAVPPPAVPGPGRPPAYGYPQQSRPTVGPGYQAVLRYRAQDGSEQQLIRRSAPGTPHPEWQIFHELRAMNVPPAQVLELHTELESCELPGAYCARMIREQWPQARITSIAPYGTDHAGRRQGMQQLLAHQGELHQVADGPARPAPVRAPLPPVQAAPPIPPEGVAQELAVAFGPGVFRFEQQAVSRQGVPPVVAHTLVMAGLPLDMGPFFWAQAQPGRPVPTLAELAVERGVQPAGDAGSYLVLGTDFGKAICVQYGTANIVAVPVEAGPGGAPVPPQFVNTGLPEFVRCLALLGRMWRLRYGLNQEQAGRWTVDFQAQLAALDPAALGSPESWWSVLLEQMWDGLL
ncbi:SUKH-4 family immunity protein [Streptomyces sp. MUSC 125]|uniref:SUKH-4 family immunity protein n=1 Tax=Streptomyces sp. MUSC 125 TaxID=1428624 RepID=UPI000583ED0A|nr:SUKH-4 family immunity protein [Streptomyces sp. MUSC 125]